MSLNLRLRILAVTCACQLLPYVALAAPPAKPATQAKPAAQAKPVSPAKPATPAKQPSQGSLGSKDPGLFNLTGTSTS